MKVEGYDAWDLRDEDERIEVEDASLDVVMLRYETETEEQVKARKKYLEEEKRRREKLGDLAAEKGDAKPEKEERMGGFSSERDSPDYFVHHVTSADTLLGLELRYGVSESIIRRVNGMTNDRLTSHLVLKIPRDGKNPTHMKPTQFEDAQTERLRIQRLFQLHFPSITTFEVDFYMKANNGCIREALKACEQDLQWERENAKLLKRMSSRVESRKKQRVGVRAWFANFLSLSRAESANSSGSNVPVRLKQNLAENSSTPQCPEIRSPRSGESFLDASPISPLMQMDALSFVDKI